MAAGRNASPGSSAGKALEVILSGMDVDAATAEAWAATRDRPCPTEVRRFVDKVAARIASAPPSAIACAKRAVDAALGDVATGLRVEGSAVQGGPGHPAARERLQAILDAGAQTREFELGEISQERSESPSGLTFTGTTSPSWISPASSILASWSPMAC